MYHFWKVSCCVLLRDAARRLTSHGLKYRQERPLVPGVPDLTLVFRILGDVPESWLDGLDRSPPDREQKAIRFSLFESNRFGPVIFSSSRRIRHPVGFDHRRERLDTVLEGVRRAVTTGCIRSVRNMAWGEIVTIHTEARFHVQWSVAERR
jgi:hypothetical protein